MRVGIAGYRTTIAKAFVAQCPTLSFTAGPCATLRADLDAYLICAGYLAGLPLLEIGDEEANRTWASNFLEPARLCDRVLAENDRARICVVGSESGIAGSYDMAYAGAKAALHLYVRTKALRTPDQQLVAIAPHIIRDSGMTGRRNDQESLKARERAHRAARFISAGEVAAVAKSALFGPTTFLSNTVIELRGDKR